MEQETDRSVSTGAPNGRPQDSKQPPREMDVGGKHRKNAELYRLHQEIRYLEVSLPFCSVFWRFSLFICLKCCRQFFLCRNMERLNADFLRF